MKYGDVVTYVRNGVAMNALVLQSQELADGERLVLAYADPQFSGAGITRAIATAFDVKPFVDGANQGWVTQSPDPQTVEPAVREAESGLPSATDLDAVAEESKVAEATGAEELPESQPEVAPDEPTAPVAETGVING